MTNPSRENSDNQRLRQPENGDAAGSLGPNAGSIHADPPKMQAGNPDNPYANALGGPPPASRNHKPVYMLLGIFGVLFLICCGVLSYASFALHQSVNRNATADLNARRVDMDDYALVARAMERKLRPYDQADALSIESRVQEILDLLEDGEDYSMIDAEGFVAQMKRTVNDPDFMFVDAWMIQRQIEDVMYPPDNYDNFSIRSIDRLSDNWVVVYLVLWDDDYVENADEQRWWLVRRDDTWMLADHERLDEGLSEAEEYAYLHKHSLEKEADNYYEFWDTAIEIYGMEDEEEAFTELERISRLPVPGPLRDSLAFHTAQTWYYLGQYERAILAHNQVRRPSRIPGVYFGKASAALELEDYDEVIAQTDSYLPLIGFSLSASSMRATAFEELGKTENAIKELRKILSVAPMESLTVDSLVRLLPSEDASELVELLIRSDAKETLLAAISDSIYDYNKIDLLHKLSDAASQQKLPKPLVEYLQANCHQLQFEYESALPALRRCMQQTDYRLIAERSLTDYLYAMNYLGRIVEAFEEAPNQQAAFEYLFESESTEISFVEAQSILDIYAANNPDSDRLKYWRAFHLVESGSLEEAGTLLSELSQNASEESGVETLLTRIAMLQDRCLPRYEQRLGDEMAFSQLGNHFLSHGRLSELRDLINRHLEHADETPAVALMRAKLLRLSGETQDALDVLTAIDESDDYYFEYERDDEIAKLIIDESSPPWESYLRDAENQAEAFDLISSALVERERFEDLRRLHVIHDELNLVGTVRYESELELAWGLRDDERLFKTFDGATKTDLDELGDYWADLWRKRLVPILLKRNELTSAERISDKLSRGGDETGQVLVAIEKRDPPSVRRAMLELKNNNDYFDWLSFPGASKEYQNASEFQDLRSVFAVPLPYSIHYDSVSLLHRDEPKLSVGLIDQRFRDRFGDLKMKISEISVEEFSTPGLVTAFKVEQSNSRVAVFVVENVLPANRNSLDPAPVRNHRFRIQICSIEPYSVDRRPNGELFQRICLGLLNDACSGAIDWNGFFLPRPERQLEQSFQGYDFSDSAYVYSQGMGSREYYRRLRDARAGFIQYRQSPNPEAKVSVGWKIGDVEEVLWLRVVKVLDEDNASLLCEVEDNSALTDFATTGSFVSVSVDRIMQWDEE